MLVHATGHHVLSAGARVNLQVPQDERKRHVDGQEDWL